MPSRAIIVEFFLPLCHLSSYQVALLAVCGEKRHLPHSSPASERVQEESGLSVLFSEEIHTQSGLEWGRWALGNGGLRQLAGGFRHLMCRGWCVTVKEKPHEAEDWNLGFLELRAR